MVTRDELLIRGVVHAVCLGVLVVVVYPLYFMVIASVSDPVLVREGRVWLWPQGLTFEGYHTIFQDQRILTGYANTLAYTLVGAFLSLAITLPAAYALGRPGLRGRKVLMFLFVFTLFFSGGLIPTYMTIKGLGMIDTFWVMVVPTALNVYNLIIARSYFETSLPVELYEAARMDGCGEGRYFFQVALPLSKVIVAVILLFNVVAKWNEYFTALIYLQSQDLMPLQIVLRDILLMNDMFKNGQGVSGAATIANLGDLIKYGIIIVSTLPIMVLYPFLQKSFEKGIMMGAIKG